MKIKKYEVVQLSTWIVTVSLTNRGHPYESEILLIGAGRNVLCKFLLMSKWDKWPGRDVHAPQPWGARTPISMTENLGPSPACKLLLSRYSKPDFKIQSYYIYFIIGWFVKNNLKKYRKAEYKAAHI